MEKDKLMVNLHIVVIYLLGLFQLIFCNYYEYLFYY